MTDKQILVPSADHPITVERHPGRISVSVAGQTIGATTEALTLREASYPPVHYVPRKDVDMSALTRTDHQTYCPYKGDCSYYSIETADGTLTNAVWTYEQPYASVAEIGGYLAFYPDRVDLVEE
ncbi:DUF427 domain-containing protein [Rugosimonospora africana]|uniref:DUF427 domain-containing protein n=1 Tax=Rugosimonospora africana TaxID=556532 RepID=A0A8J3VVB9_9ACTN|nr:DUF427 domain-containing protein [Rugosimonospora africana]GIH20125.1 hypothetical protein Raf01_82970 [Rugosimonospora africana]